MRLLTLSMIRNLLFKIKKYSITLLRIVLFSMISLNAIAKDEITLPENAVYIDVRTWVEHKIDHIEGDPRIHVSDIVEGVKEQFPAKDTPIRLYCRSGIRSNRATNKLKAQGYLDVQNIGGINDARELRGLAVEK